MNIFYHNANACLREVSIGVVRTTYLIDENGFIVKANDKVKAAEDPENMLQELEK